MEVVSQNSGYIQRVVSNPEKLHCPICEGISNLLGQRMKNNENQFDIPCELGYGSLKRIKLGDFIEICFYDMQPLQNIQLSGRTQGDVYHLSFCMGEGMLWQETISGQTMELAKNSGMLYHIGEIKETCLYEKNRHYQAITLSFHSRKFSESLFSSGRKDQIFTNRYANYQYISYILPPEAKIIIVEALRCPYSGTMQTLYLEGKALELLAVCVNAMMERNLIPNEQVRLSKMEVESIAQAKEILDNSISRPMTITALARSVCLNETKLKSGFKHIYGKPVYGYLLEKRMNTARIMLETQRVSVAQTANFVGYESSSSFSKAFYKKYGFYPSECIAKTRFRDS